MLEPAPISVHLDLYRYWLSKREGRLMPARNDIDPTDIPALLPYVSIVHKVEGKFRFRLVGSAIGRQFGRELTGDVVGSHVSNAPESTAILQALGERVFSDALPVFSTGQHLTASGTVHNVSVLLLPLSGDGERVNMMILTRLARFASDVIPSRDWLGGTRFRLCDAVNVHDALHLENLCLDWERTC